MIKHFRKILALFIISMTVFSSNAFAGDKEIVQVFYNLLSNPGSKAMAQESKDVTSESWESIGNYTNKNKNRAAFLGQMNGFSKLIPDMNWEVKEMYQSGANVIVRSRATGTPKGPFFGVDGQGRSFEILTIDIHEIKDNKIVRTYHVEDWAGALQQLKGR